MALNIVISDVTDLDYDGNEFSIKLVACKIDDVLINEIYSFPISTSENDIISQVNLDLLDKGYVF